MVQAPSNTGVSIDAGDALVDRIKPMVKSTRRSGADGTIGGFGGAFDLKAAGYTDPILISGTDGVGTKLRIAIDTGRLALQKAVAKPVARWSAARPQKCPACMKVMILI